MIDSALIDQMLDWCVDCDDVYVCSDDSGDCCHDQHRRLIEHDDVVWAICRRCRGHGFLRGYPGVYTAEDFADDPDFADDYREHTRTCEDCAGTGKTREISARAAHRVSVQRFLSEWYREESIARQERMMGA